MAITINTSSSYNVIINLGEPGAQVQTLPFWTYSPRISGVLPIFSPPLELGVVFQLTIRGLSPSQPCYLRSHPISCSPMRDLRGAQTPPSSVRKHPDLSGHHVASFPPVWHDLSMGMYGSSTSCSSETLHHPLESIVEGPLQHRKHFSFSLIHHTNHHSSVMPRK